MSSPARHLERELEAEESVAQLVGRLGHDLGELVHDEIELAKAEIKEEVAKSGKAAGMLGGTALAAYLSLLMLAFAAAWGLAELIAIGWAFLCVAAIFAAVAAMLFVAGRKRLKQVDPVPKQTVQTIKEDVAWAKAQRS